MPVWSQGWGLLKGYSRVNCRMATADLWGAELGPDTVCTKTQPDTHTCCTDFQKARGLHGCRALWERFTWLSALIKNHYFLLHFLDELHPRFIISSCLMTADCPRDLSLSPAYPYSNAVGLHLLGEILCIWVVLCYELICLSGTI